MEPNSGLTFAVLVALALIALAGSVRARRTVIRLLAGVLALVIAAAAGITSVNDYYGYYQTWSQLSADLSGTYAPFTNMHAPTRSDTGHAHGQVVSVPLPGSASGINRGGLVYLPPQYSQRAYAHTRFPVVELLHGTPGSPHQWMVQLNVQRVADRLINEHLMGPTVLVMPTMSVGRDAQECVDAPGGLDDTYITRDVRSDIQKVFRVSRVPAEWGVAGYSSGGYCAVNLALRHRASFGAAGILDGYFRPQDGPAASALHHNAAAMAANNPLRAAMALSRRSQPLPSFWMSAGTGVAVDFRGAVAFAQALHGVEQVTLYREPGQGHNFYAWAPAVPRMLAWMWTQLAPPSLRVAFPVAGPVRNSTIIAPTMPRRRHHGRAALHHHPRRAHSHAHPSRTPAHPTTAVGPRAIQ